MRDLSSEETRALLEELDWLRNVVGRRSLDGQSVDDDLQEVVVRALRTPPPKRASLRSWLLRVAHTVALDRVRGEGRRRAREQLAVTGESVDERAPWEQSEERRQAAEVQRALGRLREPYRMAVRLRYLEGLSALAAARLLDVSPEVLRQRTRRGLLLLRTELESVCPRHHAGWLGLTAMFRRGSRPELGRLRGLQLAPVAALVAAVLVVTWATLAARAEDDGARPVCAGASTLEQTAATSRNALQVPGPAPARALLEAGLEPYSSQPPSVGAPAAAREYESAAGEQVLFQPLDTDGNGLLQPGDGFGNSVAQLGSEADSGARLLAIGADSHGRADGDPGAIWLLTLDARQRVLGQRRIAAAEVVRASAGRAGMYFGYELGVAQGLADDDSQTLLVGAPRYSSGAPGENGQRGRDGGVWILFLDALGELRRSVEISAATAPFGPGLDPDGNLGSGVTGLGDVDGDRIPDIAVGAHDDNDGGPHRGAVWILFMRRDGSVREARKISQTSGGFGGRLLDGAGFGQGAAGLGDLNGDGVPDLAVGAWNPSGAQGAVWILFLREDGSVLEQRCIEPGQEELQGPRFGKHLTADDLDEDGLSDLVVGSSTHSWVLFLDGSGAVQAHLAHPLFGGAPLALGFSGAVKTRPFAIGRPVFDEHRGALLFQQNYDHRELGWPPCGSCPPHGPPPQ